MPDALSLVDEAIRGKRALDEVEADILSIISSGAEGIATLALDGHPRGIATKDTPSSSTPLLRAVQAQRPDVVSLLLRVRANVDVADSKGVTALHMAVFDGIPEIIDGLIQRNANVDARDVHGQSALFFAPHKRICAQLFRAKADVNALNNKGQSALHLSAHAGLNDAVSWLLEKMDPGVIDAQDKYGRTALYCAAHSNVKSTMFLLRDHGADTSLRPHMYRNGQGKTRKSQHAMVAMQMLDEVHRQHQSKALKKAQGKWKIDAQGNSLERQRSDFIVKAGDVERAEHLVNSETVASPNTEGENTSPAQNTQMPKFRPVLAVQTSMPAEKADFEVISPKRMASELRHISDDIQGRDDDVVALLRTALDSDSARVGAPSDPKGRGTSAEGIEMQKPSDAEFVRAGTEDVDKAGQFAVVDLKSATSPEPMDTVSSKLGLENVVKGTTGDIDSASNVDKYSAAVQKHDEARKEAAKEMMEKGEEPAEESARDKVEQKSDGVKRVANIQAEVAEQQHAEETSKQTPVEPKAMETEARHEENAEIKDNMEVDELVAEHNEKVERRADTAAEGCAEENNEKAEEKLIEQKQDVLDEEVTEHEEIIGEVAKQSEDDMAHEKTEEIEIDEKATGESMEEAKGKVEDERDEEVEETPEQMAEETAAEEITEEAEDKAEMKDEAKESKDEDVEEKAEVKEEAEGEHEETKAEDIAQERVAEEQADKSEDHEDEEVREKAKTNEGSNEEMQKKAAEETAEEKAAMEKTDQLEEMAAVKDAAEENRVEEVEEEFEHKHGKEDLQAPKKELVPAKAEDATKQESAGAEETTGGERSAEEPPKAEVAMAKAPDEQASLVEAVSAETASNEQKVASETKGLQEEIAPVEAQKGGMSPTVLAKKAPKQEDVCLQWEVVLTKDGDAQRFGFSHSSGRSKFAKLRGSLGNLDEGPDVLVVKKLSGTGLLDLWNSQHPHAAVQAHDRIAEVNGLQTMDGMVQELRKPSVRMQIIRYPDVFHVELLKRPEMSKYGFKFEKPSNARLAELRITDMSESGLLEEVNRHHISEGLYHLVVTPGMRIIGANAIEGDAGAIAQELRSNAHGVRLRMRRCEIVEGAKNKLRQQVNVLSAFTSAKGSTSRLAFAGAPAG